MPKIIEVPDFGNVEFPDSMPDDKIAEVIRLQFYDKQQEYHPDDLTIKDPNTSTVSALEQPKTEQPPLVDLSPKASPSKPQEKPTPSSQKATVTPPGKLMGIAHALERGLKQGSALTESVLAAGATGSPTMRQERKAFVKAMTDPQYQERLMQAYGDAGRQQKVERTLGPRGKLEQARAPQENLQQALAADIAKQQQSIAAVPKSEAQQELANAKTTAEKWAAWRKNPVELTASIAMESLPPSVVGAVVGSATMGPGVGTATGAGIASGLMTFSSEFLGNAANDGVNLQDEKSVEQFLKDDARVDRAMRPALVKSGIVGTVDAVTAGTAGKFIEPALKQGLRQRLLATGKELGMQAAGGAGGEALGQVASGQPLDTFDIAMEAVAEIASSPAEVAGNLMQKKPEETSPLATVAADPMVKQVAPLTAAVLTDQAQVTPPNEGKETPVDQPETTEQRLTREAQPAIESFNAAKKAEAEQQPLTTETPEGGVDQSEEEGQKEGVQVTPTEPTGAAQVAPEGNVKSQLANALERYDGTGEITVRDLADEVESMGESDVPETIRTALEAYRDALNEDFNEHAGRGDVEPFEDAFVDAIRNAVGSTEQVATTEQSPKPTTKSAKSKSDKQPFPGKEEIINQFSKTSSENEANVLLGKLYMQAVTKEENFRLRDAYREWQGSQQSKTKTTKQPNVPPTTDTSATQEPVAATVQPNATEPAGSPTQETQTKGEVKETPKRVRIAGAQFDVVGANPDGTLRLKNQNGDEFDSNPGEQWTEIDTTSRSETQSDASNLTRDEFQRQQVEQKKRGYAIALLEAENAIRKQWKPSKPLPVGANKITAFMSKTRFVGNERKLRTQYEIAKRNLDSYDPRTDQETAGKVWDKLNTSKKSTPNATPTVTPERVPTTSGEPATQAQTQETAAKKEEVAQKEEPPKPEKAEIPAPPTIEFEMPAPDTPEAAKLRSEDDAASKAAEALYEKKAKAEGEERNSKSGSKKQDAAREKVQKWREAIWDIEKKNASTHQKATMMRLEHLARNGHPAQRWAATVQILQRRAEAIQKEGERLREEGNRKEADAAYWKAKELGNKAREIGNQAYLILQENIQKTLMSLGATHDEALFEAQQTVNMQMSYPGMKSVEEVSGRMLAIEGDRIKKRIDQEAEDLLKEFGILRDDSLRERLKMALPDEKRAKEILAEFREKYESQRQDQQRKEKEAEQKAKEAQESMMDEARKLQDEGKLFWTQYSVDSKSYWRPVSGKAVKVDVAPNHQFFVYKSAKGVWSVVESTTGLSVGQGPTQGEAITMASDRITKLTYEKFEQLVADKAKEAPAKPDITAQPAQPIGMGGAVKDEFGPKAKFTAEMRAEAIDADRAKRGQPPLVKAMRQSDESVWIEAMAVIDNDWNAPAELLRSIQQTPRVLTPVEMMLMLYYKVDLKNTFDKLDREMQQAQAEGRAEAAEAAREERDRKLKTLDEVEKAVGIGDTGAATMAGRALRAYQLVMNEDFSLGELSRRFEAAAGRKATDEEMAELRKRAADWERTANEYDALLKAYEQNARDDALKAAFERTHNEVKQQPRYSKQVLDKVEAFAKKWDVRSANALERIKARIKGGTPPGAPTAMHAGPGIDPALFDDLVEFGVGKLIRGTVELAKWTEEIVSEVGEWFADHAKAVYDAAQKRLDTDLDKDLSGSTPATKQQAKKATKERKHLSPDEQVEQILKNLGKKKLDEIQNSRERMDKIRNTTRRLARLFVEQGVTSRDELVDRLFEVLSPVVPDLTREETRDAFSGYGVYYPPSKETVDVILRDLRTQLQQIGKLEDMARGDGPKKTGAGRAEMSDEARRLVKQVEEAKKKGGYVVTDHERQLRTALQAVQRRLENQIADLEKEIAERKKIIREPRKLEYDEHTLKLKARRDELKVIHDQVFAKPEMTEAERLEKWKQNIRRRIDDYTQRLADHDFGTRKKPAAPRLDAEAIRLRFEMHKIHRAVLDMRIKAELEKRTWFKKKVDAVGNIIRFSRAVMTGGEFSAVLRQGGLMALPHPLMSARSLVPMFKAFASEQGQFKSQEDIQTRPNAPLYQKAGLEFTEAGVRLSTMEEQYMFRVSERIKNIPGMGKLVGAVEAFQRAYTTYLNDLRANAFDMMTEAYGYDENTIKAIANYINVTTGRGSSSLGKYAVGMNTVFFAPRYTISRFQFLIGQPIYSAKGLSNKGMITKEYLRVLGGAGAVLGLAMMAGLDMEKDPRSPDFGKIIIGDTRIDFLAGLVQALRFSAVIATGWRKENGKRLPIREVNRLPKDFGGGSDRARVPYGKDMMWVISKFLRTKLSPSIGGTLSWTMGKDPVGGKFTAKDWAAQSFFPITWSDIISTGQQEGFSKAAILSIGAMFGLGLQTYDNNRRPERPDR